MVNTLNFYRFLEKNKINFFTGVPDSLLKELCSCITDNSCSSNNIIAANEGNAIALAAGYHLATGRIGAVYMQNSGEGNAVNPLLSLADPKVYSIPMLLIIGWRGEPGVHDEPQHIKQGEVTIDLLKTMGIPFQILGDSYVSQINKLINLAKKQNRPVALVIKKGTFDKYQRKKQVIKPKYDVLREQALDVILKQIGKDIVVSTTGKESREIFELREKYHQKHNCDFLTVGSMGHTASIAAGIALQTKKKVWCLDGDGSFIMHMGSLAIVAQNVGNNFRYIINNNASHESVGGQPTIANRINIKNILVSCGFKHVYEAKTLSEIKNAMSKMKSIGKSALIIYTKPGSRDDLGRPTVSPINNKKAFMKNLK